MSLRRVTVLGSGNWGSVIAKIVAESVLEKPHIFHKEVKMWVHEELLTQPPFDGRKLTDVINEQHENVKYLPNIALPHNIVADPSIVNATKHANVLVIVLPHQFLRRSLADIKGKIPSDTPTISLIKGVDFDDKGLVLFSDVINQLLGVECSVLMGANIASQIADMEPAEATVGAKNPEHGMLFRELFSRPYFHINSVKDVPGVELCGALKNIVAIAAGLSDGLGLKDNTKAALIRVGLLEMKQFVRMFYPPVHDQTFLESCGVADLVTTCYAGRNRKVAEAFVTTKKPFDVLEREMLAGQKLQGTLTAKEVQIILSRHSATELFPLFTRVYQIAYEKMPAVRIIEALVPVRSNL